MLKSISNLFCGPKTDFLLATARGVQFTIAAITLVVAIIGLLIATFFHVQSMSNSYEAQELPPKYIGSGKSVNIDIVSKRLSPPVNVRLVIENNIFTGKLRAGSVVGFFEADTPNKMGIFPNDLSIIGGVDGEMFDRVSHPRNRKSAITITGSLAEEINQALKNSPDGIYRTFELKVIVYDEYKNRSAPTSVKFKLFFSMEKPNKETGNPQAIVDSSVSKELKELAFEISTLVAPAGTPARFKAYNLALTVPADCAAADTPEFIRNYRNAFEQLKENLNKGNIEAFYKGVCDAWQAAVREDNEKIILAENARSKVDAQNEANRRAMLAETEVAISARNKTLFMVGSALGTFVLVVLVLAFLVMESHSKAIRLAVEELSAEAKH